MGLAIVRIGAEVLAQALTTQKGYRGIRVDAGLPEGCELVHCEFAAMQREALLLFSGPGLPEPILGQSPRVVSIRVSEITRLCVTCQRECEGCQAPAPLGP